MFTHSNPSTARIFTRSIVVFTIAILTCNGSLYAQLEGKAESDKASGLMFTCVALGEMPDEPLFYRDGESYLPVELFPGTRSAPMFLRKSEVFSLFVAKVTDEQTTYREVGRSKLIPETRRLLFLLDEVANAAEMKLRIIAIDDSLKAFPPGTFRFFNFTSTNLQVRLAGQVAGIDPGKMEVVKSRVDVQGAFVPFLIGDQKGKVIFETRLFGHPTGREMVFIGKPDKKGGLPKVKFLTQIIPRKLPVAP